MSEHSAQERTERATPKRLEEARRVVHALRPHSLDQRSLPDAIERTAVRWHEETGIPLTTITTGDPVPLHPDIEVTLLRATQEALANIRKHAQATAVQITLSYIDDVVVLDVQDNGVGAAAAGAAAVCAWARFAPARIRAKHKEKIFMGVSRVRRPPGPKGRRRSVAGRP